jgi:hypothetical protein
LNVNILTFVVILSSRHNMYFNYLVPVMFFSGKTFTTVIWEEEDSNSGVNVAFIYYLN